MTNQNRNLAYAAILILSISACNTAPNSNTAEDNKIEKVGKKEASSGNAAAIASPKNNISDKKIKAVTTIYLNIKNALVESDAEIASTKAAQMQHIVGEEKDERMQDIIEDAYEIANSSCIEELREIFEDLSENLYKMLKAQGVRDGELYRQFCPMAMDNKGAYWLSAEKEIRNPYFGDRMLKCGSVRETLK